MKLFCIGLMVITLYSCQSTKEEPNLKKSEDKTAYDLQGSWRIHEIQYHYTDTIYTMNEVAKGRFIFSDSNYALMYHPTLRERTPFKKLAEPTDEELIYGFRSVVFNTGEYIENDSILTTTADIAKVPGFEGGKQFYNIEYTGDELSLTMYDETYPDGQKPEWFGNLKVKFSLRKE